jgi:hypothetical protein
VLNANFDASSSGSNVAYLHVEQLTSMFNENTGEPSGDVIASNPLSKDRTRGSVARFNLSATGRTMIDRLSTQLLDENGENLITTSNTFVSFRFTCMRENLCPTPKKEKKRTK